MNTTEEKTPLVAKLGPSVGSSLRNWFKVIFYNGVFLKLKYYPRFYLTLLISILGIPFRTFEHWRFNSKIYSTKIKKDPIFIIGHWRSGTTLLHNILTQDPQFGYITMLEASFPQSFLITNFFKGFMNLLLPKKRPMDNMELGINLPQEEEMALSNLIPFSFYNALYFPETMMENFYRYVCFDTISRRILDKWQRAYLYLIKKTTFFMKGKQLVLKNPANTARIKVLIKMFPNAKFIHIYRNPYVVFQSTRNLYKNMLQEFMFQDVSERVIQRNILAIYKNLLTRYFSEMKLIPKNNLYEIKFEDFELNPFAEIEKVYKGLKLTGFDKAKIKLKDYISSLDNYKKNIYEFSKNTIEKVTKHWKFAIDKWNYKIPSIKN